jgi:hypothetical protein
MRRREFIITILGGIGWPLCAQAQQRVKIPRVGVLWHAGSAQEEAIYLSAFQRGLSELGYVEGRTILWNIVFQMKSLIDLSVWRQSSLP